MPTPQFALPQQFGRFLVAGAAVFTLSLWLTSSFAISVQDAQRDRLAVRLIVKGLTTQPFSTWLRDLHAAWLPFFLGQRPLVVCYLISVVLAWATAFLYDIRILRKENIV